MCNARLILQEPIELLDGPASAAVEKSNKRPRHRCREVDSPAASFDMDALFRTIERDDMFPTIAWDLDSPYEQSYSTLSVSVSSFADSDDDDDEERDCVSVQTTKRARSGMLRSVSFNSDLALLSPAASDASDASLIQIRKLDEALQTRRLVPGLLASSAKHRAITACAS